MSEQKKEFTYQYVYPSDLRDYHINGAFGGVTPRREINMHFYNERHAIPKEATYELIEESKIGKELHIKKDYHAVRVVQASISMDVNTAISIRNWLDERITLILDVAETDKKEEGNNGG